MQERERERERERPVDQTEEEMQIKKRDRQGAECEEADRGEWSTRGVGRDVHARAQQSAALSADRGEEWGEEG